MSTSPSSSAQQARQAIADRLREILRDSGMTARAFARQAGWDETKCSRLIHGRTPPSDEDIRTWCQICGVPEEIPNLIAASRNADAAYVEWRRVQRSQRRMQELRLSLYEETSLFRFYCCNVIPWPLQTPGYMRALMTNFSAFHGAVTDIEDGVKARMARRRFLAGNSRRCAMLIEESVLRNRIADDDVMVEQLRYLLPAMRQPNLSLGIIPMSARRSQVVTETFSIYDEARVFIELVSAAVTIAQPREIDLYVRYFAELAASAVHGEQAHVLISAAIEALE
ncbi:helix-turn-helix domain-containing protein [Streptosporangium subroseum]|uniref:helix-turn-helix domain-containing protein n=1 Tax=Streptosporangium subroseum TaxID=106412 RepID=UPI0030851FCD|nr:helix-turn-helix transcriptional regulator [Streptosporangium subroseum]